MRTQTKKELMNILDDYEELRPDLMELADDWYSDGYNKAAWLQAAREVAKQPGRHIYAEQIQQACKVRLPKNDIRPILNIAALVEVPALSGRLTVKGPMTKGELRHFHQCPNCKTNFEC